MNRALRLIPDIRQDRYLPMAVLGLVCLTYVNMLYCTLGYEFGRGQMTFLAGPDDRFADVIKLSLSYRSVTQGLDETKNFQSWNPVYQHYYEYPDYGGLQSLAKGELTHFHHPPFSTLVFLLCGIFLVWTGSPPLLLLLFFSIYLLEVWAMIRIGISREKRTLPFVLGIWFFCLASYPALVIFGRGNYVNAGLTTIPITAFLLAAFTGRGRSVAALVALAMAVNIHPNAIIFLVALPLAYGLRRAIKPVLHFTAIALAMLGASYFAAHALYPDYSAGTFLQGVAIYGKIYVAGGAGLRMGSSLYGLVRSLNHGLRLGISFAAESKVFYAAAVVLLIVACSAVWRDWIRGQSAAAHEGTASERPRSGDRMERLGHAPAAVTAFFLASFYCILSPVFADYHLLVFIAPLFLTMLEAGHWRDSSRLLTLVAAGSLLMLSPKNYPLQHASVQVIVNPLILCVTVLWLSIASLTDVRQPAGTTARFADVKGQH
jgi:hypothetical protein